MKGCSGTAYIYTYVLCSSSSSSKDLVWEKCEEVKENELVGAPKGGVGKDSEQH